MNLLSQIQQVQARISQIETTHLYTDHERNHRLEEAKRELAKYTAQINQIEVNQPEILS